MPKISQFIKINEPVKISDVINYLTGYKSYTIKKDMKYLVDEGIIKKIGKGRATIYIINERKN